MKALYYLMSALVCGAILTLLSNYAPILELDGKGLATFVCGMLGGFAGISILIEYKKSRISKQPARSTPEDNAVKASEFKGVGIKTAVAGGFIGAAGCVTLLLTAVILLILAMGISEYIF